MIQSQMLKIVHKQQKFKKMSKIFNKYDSITQSSLKQIKSFLNKQINQKKSLSLFDKLQIYDRIIGQFHVSRTDPQVLKIFAELISDHGQMPIQRDMDDFSDNFENFQADFGRKNKNYSGGIFSSPTYNKKQNNDVDDPQLFSFSKTRKQQNSSHVPKQIVTKVGAFSMFQKNKIPTKLNSDKPRYTTPIITQPNQRKVSQFNSQLDVQKHQKNTNRQSELQSMNSLHHLARKVRLNIITKNSLVLFKFLRRNILQRKKQFKVRTSQFIYQLKLLRKSWQSIKIFNQKSYQIINQFRQTKNKQKLSNFFGEWYFYANRSEQQRLREKQVKVKQVFLQKITNIRRFIRNSQIPIQQLLKYMAQKVDRQQNVLCFRKFQQQVKNRNKDKSERLRKFLLMRQVRLKIQQKRQIKQKEQRLNLLMKQNSIKLLIKLLLCIKQAQRIKYDRITIQAEYKINGIRFLSRLKREYHFLRVYWGNQNFNMKTTRRQEDLNQFMLQSSKYQVIQNKNRKSFPNPEILNPKYQKIVFIYQILDCVQHNLHRKGYAFLQSFSQKKIENKNNPILQSLLQEHPAYINYYRPYKLLKYFTALKHHLLGETKTKIDMVKYKINGRRVLNEGLLKWYKDQLVKTMINQQVQHKTQELDLFLGNKHKGEFFRLFGSKLRYFDKKESLWNFIKNKKIVETLRIFKTYTISKSYYRKIILQSKMQKRMKIQQSYFLQWKLLYAQNVHNRLLQKDLQNLRRKYAMKNIKNNISKYSLFDKIFRKKCKNLQKLRYQNYGDQFLLLLRRNWQIQKKCCYKNTKQQLQRRCQLIQLAQIDKQKNKFIEQLMQYWYQSKLQKQICSKIDRQYKYKLLQKSFECLKQMRKVEKEQQQKKKKIQTKRQSKVKRGIMGKFVDMMIKKILLKRMITFVKKYHFSFVKQAIFTQQEQNLQTQQRLL